MAQLPIKVKIDEATKAQLRLYSVQNLGGEFDGKMPIGDMREAVRVAVGGDDEFTLVQVAGVPGAEFGDAPALTSVAKIVGERDTPIAEAAADDDEAKMNAMVRIMISPDEANPRPVPVSHNGVAILIPRGRHVEVRRKYVEILHTAVKVVPIVDPETTRIVGWRSVHVYPFSVVSQDPEVLALQGLPKYAQDVAA